jgi:cobalt-zinc-cadmium efflux system outer membrane protein
MRSFALCASVLALAGAAHAANQLTLEQALDLADRNHPQLQASAAVMEAAAAGIITARAYPNPEGGFMAGRQIARVPGAIPGADFFYTFSQPLELGALRPARIGLAQRGVESSRFAHDETRLLLLTEVRRAFRDVVQRKREITLAAANLRLVENLRERVRARVDVGEAGTLELNRAEAEVAAARTLANGAQLRLVAAMAQLRAAVGAPLPADFDVQESESVATPVLNFEEVRREVLERHPSLLLARSEMQRAEARLAYEKALRRPQPYLRTEVETLPDTPTWRVGIAIPVPTWNRREGPIAEAAALVRQAARLAEARQIEVLAALDGAYERYQVAAQQLAAFEQGILREAEQALAASETAYQLGERGILEVFDAQRVLRGVRQDRLAAQYERDAALIDINGLRAEDLRRPIP